MRNLATRLTHIPSSATIRIADSVTMLRQGGAEIIDLSAGRAAEHTPTYIREAAVEALRAGLTHQTMAKGTLPYRQASAAKLKRDNGIDADPETEIMATMGVKQGLTLSFMAIINPGDEVIVEDPCFVSYQSLIRLAGGVPVAVPLRREHNFRWVRDELEAHITARTKAILLNSPHNPTGTVHTAADLDMIADLARTHDLYVVTDEVYERVAWAPHRHINMATRPMMRDRSITVMGLSKTFAMGGWRIGFIYAPARLIAAMLPLQQHLITCPNSMAQAGGVQALAEPPRPEVLDLWADWQKRCRYFTRELATIPGLWCQMPEGGFYAWTDVRHLGRTSDEIADLLLRDHHVAVIPGSAFGTTGEGYLRITCVRSWDDVREAVRRLKGALASSSGIVR